MRWMADIWQRQTATFRWAIRGSWALGVPILAPVALWGVVGGGYLTHFEQHPGAGYGPWHSGLLAAYIASFLVALALADVLTASARGRFFRRMMADKALAGEAWKRGLAALTEDLPTRLEAGESPAGYYRVHPNPWLGHPFCSALEVVCPAASMVAIVYLVALTTTYGPLASREFWAVYPALVLAALLHRQRCYPVLTWLIPVVPLPAVVWMVTPQAIPAWAAILIPVFAGALGILDLWRTGRGRVHVVTDRATHSYQLRFRSAVRYLGRSCPSREADIASAPFARLDGRCDVAPPEPGGGSLPVSAALVPGLSYLLMALPLGLLSYTSLDRALMLGLNVVPSLSAWSGGYLATMEKAIALNRQIRPDDLVSRAFGAQNQKIHGLYAEAGPAALAVLTETGELQGDSDKCLGNAGPLALQTLVQLREREAALRRFSAQARVERPGGMSETFVVDARMGHWLFSSNDGQAAFEALPHLRRAARQAPQDVPIRLLQARACACLVQSGRQCLTDLPTEDTDRVAWRASSAEACEAYEAALEAMRAGNRPLFAAGPAELRLIPKRESIVEELFSVLHATRSRERTEHAAKTHGLDWARGELRTAVLDLADDLVDLGRASEAARLLGAAGEPGPSATGAAELRDRCRQILSRCEVSRDSGQR